MAAGRELRGHRQRVLLRRPARREAGPVHRRPDAADALPQPHRAVHRDGHPDEQARDHARLPHDAGLGWARARALLSWLEVTKLQALAAKEVAKELGLRSVWSWGWAVWGKTSPENDPDKPTAACVYLWARNPKLCNGPKVAPKRFDKSRDEGQIVLPAGARCTVQGKALDWSAIRGLTPVTGDIDVAFTAAYSRIVASLYKPLKTAQIAAAEKAVIAAHFGSAGAYRRALARAHASPSVARGVIADELRRELIEANIHVPPPSGADVKDYYASYAETPVRLVQSKTPAPWLGGRKRGLRARVGRAAAALPPEGVGLGDDPHDDRAVPGACAPAGSPAGRRAARRRAARGRHCAQGPRPRRRLRALARHPRARSYDYATLCYRDRQPTAGLVPLTDYLPFLAAD